MRLLEFVTRSGFIVRALASESSRGSTALLHIHGFGGDFVANRFVQRLHNELPQRGITFISMNHHLTGFLSEQYVDGTVLYYGAALSLPILAAQDASEFRNFLAGQYGELFLMGHSFGTNIVKYISRTGFFQEKLIFLSPADSVWLYDRWLSSPKNVGRNQSAGYSSNLCRDIRNERICFDQFGIAVGQLNYNIPILDGHVDQLVSDDVFGEWSKPDRAIQNRCIVVAGDMDDINSGGNTKDANCLSAILPNMEQYVKLSAGHSLVGVEDEVTRLLYDWIS